MLWGNTVWRCFMTTCTPSQSSAKCFVFRLRSYDLLWVQVFIYIYLGIYIEAELYIITIFDIYFITVIWNPQVSSPAMFLPLRSENGLSAKVAQAVKAAVEAEKTLYDSAYRTPEKEPEKKTGHLELDLRTKHQFKEMGMSGNGVYPPKNSHLVGIMIINHWV